MAPTLKFSDAFAEIRNEPLSTTNGVTSSRRAIICPDDDGVWREVGVVSNDYNLVSNTFARKCATDILDTSVLDWNEREPIFDGSRYSQSFQIMNPDYQYETRRKGDVLAATLNVVNSYDGSLKFGVQLDLVRLACLNGMTMSSVLGGFRFKHNASNEELFQLEVEQAAIQLTGMGEKVMQLLPYIAKMQEVIITVRDLHGIFESVGMGDGMRAKAVKAIANDPFGGSTLWDVYNGMTNVVAGPTSAGFTHQTLAGKITSFCLNYVGYRN